jgi:hypothetical protein
VRRRIVVCRVGDVALVRGAAGVETWQEVRRALYVGDVAAALAVARSLGVDGPLQQVGVLVLLALDHCVSGPTECAEQCLAALLVRGRDGDQELASAIDAVRGIGPVVGRAEGPISPRR